MLLEDNEVEMTERGGVYRAYVKVLYELGDRSMKQSLNDLVRGKLEELSAEYEEADNTGKREVIGRLINAYRGAARVQVQREHPELQNMRDRIPSKYTLGERAPF